MFDFIQKLEIVDKDQIGLFMGLGGTDSTAEHRSGNASLLDGFVTGSIRIMVATSAFGCGIDVKCVRGVFHYGLAWGMLEYAQETGRAGRDGNPAECQLHFCREWALFDFNKNLMFEHLKNMVGDGVCRRECIQRFVDGYGWSCIMEDGVELCDSCEALSNKPGRIMQHEGI